MSLRGRPAREADVPDLVRLQAAWDEHWFGAAEHDESEVRASLDLERSRVVHRAGRVVAAAWWTSDGGSVLIDPAIEAGPAYDELLPWLARSGATTVEALDRDRELRAALRRHRWTHVRSQFELIRDASPLPDPEWPDHGAGRPGGGRLPRHL